MPSLHKYISICIAIIFMVILILSDAFTASAHKNHFLQPKKNKSNTSHLRHDIKKLEFNRTVSGKKTLSFTLDRLSVQKSKVGFFRFALANEVHIENGHIKLYDTQSLFGDDRPIKSDSISLSSIDPIKKSTTQAAHENKVDPFNLLSEISSSLIPVKRIAKLVCKPVRVDLYDRGTLRTSISAGTATVNAEHQIVFKRNVLMTSDGRILAAHQITFDPAKGIFYVKGPYVLTRNENQTKGTKMAIDIYLNPHKP